MLSIRLLGRPAVGCDDGPVRAPRGRKAWALLGYVLLAERPPSRQRLAELLFGDADDPLGALRWSLAELRRALGVPGALRGDPVVAALGDDVRVDLDVLRSGAADPAALLALDAVLLEGVHVASSPAFASWLEVERHRLAAAVEARLRQAAAGLLATGRAEEALRCAARVVELDPLQEGNHELLVRSLALSGDRPAALRQVAACTDLLRRELGVEVSAALREAAGAVRGTVMVPPLGGRAAAAGQLDAGRAAIVAGAVDAGIQCLRRGVDEAARCGDTALRGRALGALGSALVHAVRGRDEEGAVVLHEALHVAGGAGDDATAALACRELGFVEVQAGRRATAEEWLVRAQDLAGTDDAQLAAVLGVRGLNASDRGDHPEALALLTESADRAARAGDPRQDAWASTMLGRSHLGRGEHAQAAEALERALGLVHDQRWIAFLPMPLALHAELALDAGDADTASERFARAWALGCQVGDPCWEGLAARGLGLLHARSGDRDGATGWLDEGVRRCTRVPDRYQWMHAHVLDAAVGTALDHGEPERAGPLLGALSALAARCDMRELVVRAHLHRHRLGDPTALAAARMLAADVDNPALAPLLDGCRPLPQRA